MRDAGTLEQVIVPVEDMFLEYQKVKTLPDYDFLVHNGNQVREEQLEKKESICKDQPVRLYDSKDQFTGIYEYREDRKWFQPRKMFLGGQ